MLPVLMYQLIFNFNADFSFTAIYGLWLHSRPLLYSHGYIQGCTLG